MKVKRLRHRSAVTLEVLRSPRVTLHLPDTPSGRRRYGQFTARHPTLKMVSNGFGAALMPVPSSEDEYLQGRSRALLRRKRRLAEATGFTFGPFDGADHLRELLAIHRSAPVRQQQPMQRAYLDPKSVQRYAERAGSMMGAFDSDGALKAYAHVETQGEIGSFLRLIGHADALDTGAVYGVASEAVGQFINDAQETSLPTWILCGNLWSNGPGLAYFKRRIGFKPYRARFRLQEP